MRLYIVRHADPDYPNNTITPTGHLEAQALVPRMLRLQPDRLYCSPLGRAIHTGEYSARALGKTMATEEWTREIPDTEQEIQPWGRMVAWDVPGEIIREKSPYPSHENWTSLKCFERKTIGEAFERLKGHSDEFLARHGYVRDGGRYRIVRGNREKIVVFCHGGFGLTWLAHLLEIPLPLMWSGFWLAPTSVSTVLLDERSKDWAVPRCIGLCDVSHLFAAGRDTTPHGLKANVE